MPATRILEAPAWADAFESEWWTSSTEKVPELLWLVLVIGRRPACRPSRGVDGSAGARRSALHRARTLRASLAGPCRAVGVIRLRSVRSGCCRRSDSNWGGESGARDSGRVSRVRLPPIYHPNQCFSRRCKDHPKLPVKGRCDTACGPQWSVQRRQGVARDHGHVQRHPRHRHRRGGRRGDTGADTCHEVKAKAVTTATHLVGKCA